MYRMIYLSLCGGIVKLLLNRVIEKNCLFCVNRAKERGERQNAVPGGEMIYK